MEHHTHRGICKQLAQVCWDSQRFSRSRCCEDASTKSRVIRKRRTVVVHRVIISPLTSTYGESEVRTTSREPRHQRSRSTKGYCGIPRKWLRDKTRHGHNNASLGNHVRFLLSNNSSAIGSAEARESHRVRHSDIENLI